MLKINVDMAFKSLFVFIFVAISCVFGISQELPSYTYDSASKTVVKKTAGLEHTETIVGYEVLQPLIDSETFSIENITASKDGQKLLFFNNAKRVWRYKTRGDYWIYNKTNNSLFQLGEGLPESSLLFAKFSPDGNNVAYVSGHNIYLEDVNGKSMKKLTSTDGYRKLINGTFDWAYEEEFDCRDGFSWSGDGKRIAYWQIDASDIKDFYMVNTTDSIYAQIVPVEYPKVGETPSLCRVGIMDIQSGETKWLNVPGNPRQHYIPRMEWTPNGKDIILQQLNRKQNVSKLFLVNGTTGESKQIYQETDDAWISVRSSWPKSNGNGWRWLKDGTSFLWITEKDGWRHIYEHSLDGKKNKLITKGDYDIIRALHVDEHKQTVYFSASPDNATEKYLYSTSLSGGKKIKRLTPKNQEGTHNYTISPDGKYATHYFSNYYTKPHTERISLPDHKTVGNKGKKPFEIDGDQKAASNVSFIKIEIEDGVTLDAWMAKPYDFDPAKKYPTVFYVYTEPAGQTVINRYGAGKNRLYDGDMAKDGYIYISIDNRGTPAPKGSAWRKSIYRKIGIINIDDQAKAAKKLMEQYSFIDEERIAVHGWSGGGSATLNLLFRYPDIYHTGIAVAAVANQLSYDNIYQERYMGIPQENREDFVNGSPITHAKNLKGNLLYIHGTGDDNVHYQNAEMLVNELIKHNKQFQFMPYPNRSHGIREGEGTGKHLSTLFTNYLKQNCPPGGK